MSEMDSVDAKQQQEIDDLKARASENRQVDHDQYKELAELRIKDAKHDAYFSALNGIVMFLIVTSFLNWFILFMIFAKKNP